MLSIFVFAFLALTGAVHEGACRDVSLNVPLRLYSVKRPIDGSWQSLSIEFSYMADFFGNAT